MSKRENDISLNEFVLLVEATDNGDGTWNVFMPLKVGAGVNLTVSECSSAYDAKERSYLYLMDRIHGSI